MGKRNYNMGKFLNRAAVIGSYTPPVNKKAGILTTDAYNSNKFHKNQESSDYGWISELPSSARKAYGRMSKVEKALFWLTGFAMLGVAGYASSDTVKKTVDNNAKEVYEKLFSKSGGKTPVVIPSINKTMKPILQPTEMSYQFTPDIQIIGSDEYKQKVESALNEIKRTNITEYNEVMLYLEKLRQTPDDNVGEGSFYFPEKDISPSNLIHEKEHVKQDLEPWKLYYEGKSGWFSELDAVKKQVDWEAEAYNYTAERKQQQIKNYMNYYKDRYPEQYAKWVSDS